MIKPKNPIRLFWAENYADKPKEVLEAIERGTKNAITSIHLYPGSLYEEVIQLIAKKNDISSDQIILGHGIEGLIHTTSLTFLNELKTGGVFNPSFFVFMNNLKRYKSVTVPCRYDQAINIDSFVKTIQPTDVFFLASPNTATGNYLLDSNQIEYILKQYHGLFVVDECYYGLGNQTVVPLLTKYENLLIYRGVTKVMGLGGLRFGFGISNASIIKKLNYHFRDIEFDPINTFSLSIFKEVLPYYDVMADVTKIFFEGFYQFLTKLFPNDKFTKTPTTQLFMHLSNYTLPQYKMINYLNKNNYIMEESTLTDNSSLAFPEILKLTPPPKQYWEDFGRILTDALNQKISSVDEKRN